MTPLLCFSSRPFVLCGLPVRRLSEGQLLYERRNGQFVLQVTGPPEYMVPLGQDRIVPIFLSTLAIQRKSQTTRANRSGHARERGVCAFTSVPGEARTVADDDPHDVARVPGMPE